MRNRPHLCAAGAMGRDALEGDGLKGLLAVNEERVDSVAEAGDRAGAAGPSTRTSSERATRSCP